MKKFPSMRGRQSRMSSQQQQQEPQGGSRDERNLLQENKEEEKESSLPVARLPSHSHPPHTTTSTTTTNQPSSYDMEDPPEIQRLEDAEDAILSQLEAQSKHTRTLSDGFRPAMMGERPPLGVPSVGVGWTMDFLDDDDNNNTSSNNMDPTTSSPAPVATRSRARRPSFYEMALHVQQENQQQFRPAGTSTAAARRSSFNADPSTQNYSQGDCGGRGGGLTHYNNSRNLMMTGSGSRKAHDLLVRMDRRNSGGKKYPSNPRHQDHGNTAGSRNTGSSGTPTRKANTSAAGGGGGSHELFTDLSQDVFSSTPQRLQQRHEGLSFLWNEDEDESDDDSGSDSYEDEQQQQQQDLMMSTDSTLPPPGYMKNLPPRVSSSSSKGGRSIPPEQRPLLGGEGGGGGGTMDFVGSNNPLRSAQLGEKSSSNDSISLMMTSEQRQQQEQQERAQQHHRRSQERRMKRLMKCWNPCEIFYRLLFVLSHSTLVISIPFFIMAWILYYYLGNPSLDFMPGNATLSWWLDFLGRQLLVFEIAHVTEFLLIDVMVMSSKTVVKMLGPWITIFCLQSKGWPFLLTFWGIYDMILLHGNNRFQRHWLYWTGIAIYSRANSGSYLLSSSLYLRILIGMELAGVTTTLKRTVLTLYFGKRNFDIYKPKLEELLHDIIVITEIAELAAEADALVPPPQDDNDKDDDDGARDTNKEITDDDNDSDNDNDEDDQGALSDIKNKGPLEDTLCLRRPRAGFDMVRWASVTFDDRSLSTESADDIVENVDPPPPPSSAVEASQPVDGMKNNPLGHSALMAQREVGSSRSLTSGVIKIKNLLDRWEEPVNKLDKSTKSSVHDILKFRKALTYMDLENPFGGAFGLASTRDELIKSAQTLYQQLLKLSPGLQCLPYSVLAVLSQNLDGTVDTAMKKSISNLFRADAQGEISMLAFVQTCDVVYRRLRYFRASVGNSSVIDKVLENIVNGFFAIGLTIVILSLLRFNPWPLLVSVSTLLVSFAFAIGPTAAKAIEGIILIAGTRPFDIGDRIIIANSPGQPTAGMNDSWFVEDITLFSTTLRLASNNEVAMVSNGAISGTRITNCARSKNAVVSIIMKLHLSLHDGKNTRKFQDAVENYISNNPAVWDSLMYFRCEDINTDDEYVIYHLAVRSRHSWQVATRVLLERGQLHQFCMDLSKELKVNFDSPTSRRVFYYGGNLVDGAVKDFKKNLLMDRNNISMGGPDAFLGSKGTLYRSASAPAPIPPHHSTMEEADREGTMPTDDNDPVEDIFLAMVDQSQQ